MDGEPDPVERRLSAPQRRAMDLVQNHEVVREKDGGFVVNYGDGSQAGPRQIHHLTIRALFNRGLVKWAPSQKRRVVPA